MDEQPFQAMSSGALVMTAQTLVYLILGATAGGFINGLSGTGTALFALGFYLVVLEPATAVAVVALMAILAGLQGIWIVRKQVLLKPKRLARFVIPGLLGVPIGLLILNNIDASVLRLMIATLLIVYGGYFTCRKALPAFSQSTPYLDSIIGFAGGALGGAASVSGAIPSMWISMRAWSKTETRAVLQPYNLATLSTTVCLLFLNGAYDQTAKTALLVTVPTGLIAAQVGLFVFRSLDDITFRRLLIVLTLMMGIGLLVSELI